MAMGGIARLDKESNRVSSDNLKGRRKRVDEVRGMCRNIRTLFNFDPPATDEEIRAAALQFVRKLSGFSKPSAANREVFDRAVDGVAAAASALNPWLRDPDPSQGPKGRGSRSPRAGGSPVWIAGLIECLVAADVPAWKRWAKMNETLHDVILLPGLLCDERLWTAQKKALLGSARVVIPDLTGYESIESMAGGVLDQARDGFAWRASNGRMRQLEIVAGAPVRVHRLALLSTSPKGILPTVRKHFLNSSPPSETAVSKRTWQTPFPSISPPNVLPDRALWDIFASMARSLGASVAVRQMRSLLVYKGFSGDLRKIGCPCVVMSGREDRRYPVAVHEELAGRIPGAKLKVIERAGHFTPLEEPQAVADVLRDWLMRRGRHPLLVEGQRKRFASA